MRESSTRMSYTKHKVIWKLKSIMLNWYFLQQKSWYEQFLLTTFYVNLRLQISTISFHIIFRSSFNFCNKTICISKWQNSNRIFLITYFLLYLLLLFAKSSNHLQCQGFVKMCITGRVYGSEAKAQRRDSSH